MIFTGSVGLVVSDFIFSPSFLAVSADTVNSLRSEIDLREEYIAQLNLDMERLEMELNRTYQLADEQERTAAAARVALDDLRFIFPHTRIHSSFLSLS